MSRQPFVRVYNAETDLEDVIHIFRETCAEDLKTEPVWTIGSYLWCRPYLTLCPRTCYVLDDGEGRAVGYVLGTPDSKSFASRWKTDYLPNVHEGLATVLSSDDGEQSSRDDIVSSRRDYFMALLYSNPYKAVFNDFADQLQGWPGHLHIDILPSHQRRGYGKLMLNRLVEGLAQEGCTGVYLGMVASNDGAGRFYDSCGFRRLPFELDEGTSGESGRTKPAGGGAGTIYLIRDIEPGSLHQNRE